MNVCILAILLMAAAPAVAQAETFTFKGQITNGDSMLVQPATGGGRPSGAWKSKSREVIDFGGGTTITVDGDCVEWFLPFEERVAYSRFYDSLAADRVYLSDEAQAAARMVGHFAKAALTPDDRQRLIEDASQARIVGTFRAREARKRLAAAKAMGIAPSPLLADQRSDVAALCGYAGMKRTLTP